MRVCDLRLLPLLAVPARCRGSIMLNATVSFAAGCEPAEEDRVVLRYSYFDANKDPKYNSLPLGACSPRHVPIRCLIALAGCVYVCGGGGVGGWG